MLLGLGLGIWAYTAPHWFPQEKRRVAIPACLLGAFAVSSLRNLQGIVPFAASYIAAMMFHRFKVLDDVKRRGEVHNYDDDMKPITIASSVLALIGMTTG